MLVKEVLRFWFPSGKLATEANVRAWFMSNAAFDQQIRDQFGASIPESLPLKNCTAEEALATIIMWDQFPRNIHRNTPKMFSYDHLALALAKDAIRKGLDQNGLLLDSYGQLARGFFYLPFEHSEELADQQTSVALFKQLAEDNPEDSICQSFYKYALDHQAIIQQFGRFPHRNSLLGRTSTPEETAYLEGGGETFGVKTTK